MFKVREGVERIEDVLKETEAVERLLFRLSKLKVLFWKITSYVVGDIEEEIEEDDHDEDVRVEDNKEVVETTVKEEDDPEEKPLNEYGEDEEEINRQEVYDFNI